MATSEACETGMALGSPAQSTMSSRLSSRREQLESELEKIKKAEAILDENPKLKELFNIVSQVRCF
jgi:hypothetical protein